MLICRIAEPALLNALELIPPTILAAAAFVCAALLAIDTAFTLVIGASFSQKLELLRIELCRQSQRIPQRCFRLLPRQGTRRGTGFCSEIKARSGELNSWPRRDVGWRLLRPCAAK
ncbi:MAG: hypothetical protein ACLTSX_09030 [Collinsella sp.]